MGTLGARSTSSAVTPLGRAAFGGVAGSVCPVFVPVERAHAELSATSVTSASRKRDSKWAMAITTPRSCE